jgi:hypothetical protein
MVLYGDPKIATALITTLATTAVSDTERKRNWIMMKLKKGKTNELSKQTLASALSFSWYS